MNLIFFYFQTWFRKTLVLLVKLEKNEFLMRQIGTEEISSLSKLVKLTVAEVSRDFLTLILNPFPGDFQNAPGPGPRGRAASTPYTARINFEYWAHHYLNRKFESFKIRCLEKIILNLRESDWKENLIFKILQFNFILYSKSRKYFQSLIFEISCNRN